MLIISELCRSTFFTEVNHWSGCTVSRSVLQLATRASCSKHVLAQKSFQLDQKKLRMSIEALIAGLLLFEFPRKFHLPAEQSRTEFRNPIANPLATGYRTLLSLHTAGPE